MNTANFADLENNFVPIEFVHSTTGKNLIKFPNGKCLSVTGNKNLKGVECDPMDKAQQIMSMDTSVAGLQQIKVNGGRCLAHSNNQSVGQILNLQNCLTVNNAANTRTVRDSDVVWNVVDRP